MDKEQIKEIINILSKNFKNKEINIIFSGAIEFTLKMKNIKFFITRDIIIIVDENDQEFRIDPYYIDDIEFKDNTIKIEMVGYYRVQFDN